MGAPGGEGALAVRAPVAEVAVSTFGHLLRRPDLFSPEVPVEGFGIRLRPEGTAMASGRQGNDCLPDRCSPSGADHIRGELESPVALLMGYALEDPAVFSDLGDRAVSLVDGRGERLIGEASWPLRTATRSTGMCQRSAVALAGTSTPVMRTASRKSLNPRARGQCAPALASWETSTSHKTAESPYPGASERSWNPIPPLPKSRLSARAPTWEDGVGAGSSAVSPPGSTELSATSAAEQGSRGARRGDTCQISDGL